MPHNRYQEINEEGLLRLHDGLDILEAVAREEMQELDLCLYGLTQKEYLLDSAKEAIADENDISEADVELAEIAIAIPLSADIIHALTGSGIRIAKVGEGEFAYIGANGEGVRTGDFGFANFKPTVAASDFSQMAIASSTSWLDGFLKQFGTKEPAEIKQTVRRTEEATQPGVPAPETPPSPTAPPTEPMPKQTSVPYGKKLSDLIENLLG